MRRHATEGGRRVPGEWRPCPGRPLLGPEAARTPPEERRAAHVRTEDLVEEGSAGARGDGDPGGGAGGGDRGQRGGLPVRGPPGPGPSPAAGGPGHRGGGVGDALHQPAGGVLRAVLGPRTGGDHRREPDPGRAPPLRHEQRPDARPGFPGAPLRRLRVGRPPSRAGGGAGAGTDVHRRGTGEGRRRCHPEPGGVDP